MIVIIGAGISGLGIGWRLAQAGRAVTVIERGQAGMGATWAAAGMLAPQVESEHGEEGLLPLLLESRSMWAEFARELEAASGIDVGYRDEGTMVIALDRDDREMIEHRYQYLSGLGLELQWLTGAEARVLEPHLIRGVAGAIYSPQDHQVDNRAVARALCAAYLEAGGMLREDTEVLEIVSAGDRVTGVRLPDEILYAEAVVVAAGAWSRNIVGLTEALRPPVRPVKGQMVAVRMDPDAPLLRHVVWGRHIYLVPREDGRLLIGATIEEMGFDTEITVGGVMDLLRETWEALPGIYDLPLVETWAGLRPTSRDDAPILGPTALDGLVMATGHHRNGILLCPITAMAISRYLLSGEVIEEIRPFGLSRFEGAAKRGNGAAPATVAAQVDAGVEAEE